jgi:hypothetical protein
VNAQRTRRSRSGSPARRTVRSRWPAARASDDPLLHRRGNRLRPHTPGVVVLEDPQEIHLLATLGLVLLLFHLGIEFSINELLAGGRRLLWAGPCTSRSTSAPASRSAGARGRSSSPSSYSTCGGSPTQRPGMILGIIVVEDVFLAFYLAHLQPILGDQHGLGDVVLSVAIAFAFLIGLFALARWGASGPRPAGARPWSCTRTSRPRSPSRRRRPHPRKAGVWTRVPVTPEIRGMRMRLGELLSGPDRTVG